MGKPQREGKSVANKVEFLSLCPDGSQASHISGAGSSFSRPFPTNFSPTVPYDPYSNTLSPPLPKLNYDPQRIWLNTIHVTAISGHWSCSTARRRCQGHHGIDFISEGTVTGTTAARIVPTHGVVVGAGSAGATLQYIRATGRYCRNGAGRCYWSNSRRLRSIPGHRCEELRESL